MSKAGEPETASPLRADDVSGNWPAALFCAGLALLLGAVVMDLPRAPTGLTRIVEEHLGASGVTHPVTAVLLNFRSYDTWLELLVLLLGWFGVLAARGSLSLADAPMNAPADEVLNGLVRLVAPLALLVAGYLLWLGKFSAGGAFQAGVVLGSAGVLLWLAGYRSVAGLRPMTLKLALLVGVGAFAVTALATLSFGTEMLRYPVFHAGTIIVLIEFFAAVSIAASVTALLIGLQPTAGPTTN